MLRISTPETSHFPTIQFRLDAVDAQGKFIDSLQPKDIQILEDGQPVTPKSVEKVRNGLQIILILNISPAMAKKVGDSTGYQVIQNALVDWVRSQPQNTRADSAVASGADDFSLATPTGIILIRESDLSQVVKALLEYQPDPAYAQPALGSLAEALDLASDPLSSSFMKRSILYITPALPPTSSTTITDLAKRAQGIGVKVNVWQYADPQVSGATPDSPGSFHELAAATGGAFEVINFSEPLPEIDPLFASLRSTYQVQYASTIQKSGAHNLIAQVKQADATLVSNDTTFDLNVQPPSPIFLSPPASVTRSWVGTDKNVAVAGNAAPSLAPESVDLQILVEFPDQHQRDLKVTRLYVDNQLVAENTTAPFDKFSWSLSDFDVPARKMLRAEVVDTLGLSSSSIDIPIEILVEQPAQTNLAQGVTRQGIIAIGAVAAAGLVLALVLLLTSNQRRARRKHQQNDKQRKSDPVTQAVPIKQERARGQKATRPLISFPKFGSIDSTPSNERSKGIHLPNGSPFSTSWSNSAWQRKNGQTTTPARLVSLDDNEQPITGGVISLTRQEITFGTDPQRATQVLDSPTVGNLHARLFRSTEGDFYLADQGSVAGTWVNYASVTTSGVRLEHGDLIHIGRLMYRFELAEPVQTEIKVIELDQLP